MTDPRTNVNLLPSWYRRRVLMRAALAAWASVGAIGLSAASLVSWRAERQLQSTHLEVAKFGRMYAPTQIMDQELAQMKRRLVQVQSEEVAAAKLEDRRPALALLGMIGEAAGACDERLHVRECLLQQSPGDRGPADSASKLLTIKGAGLDLISVTKFQSILRDCRMFHRVELKSTVSELIGSNNGFAFQIECEF